MTNGTRAVADAGERSQMRILQVSTRDQEGGAERVALELQRAYRDRGYESWLAVGHRLTPAPDVFEIPKRRGRPLDRVARLLDEYRGREPFQYPGTWRLLDLAPVRPTIVHAHNLHHHYFDLRVLPWLSAQLPVVLTLHDAWLFTGHCSHSLDCRRWEQGCGECPDLTLYPAIRRDGTRSNLRRKREILMRTRPAVVTPSRWLMQQLASSLVAEGLGEVRVIPNGVDRTVFRPAAQAEARQALGIDPAVQVLLFAANGIRSNPWKDYRTMLAAMARVRPRRPGVRVVWLAIGEEGGPQQVGDIELRFVPYQTTPQAMARYYQAADLYVHAARVDTFPTTVLEALACGVPVIGTAVGGIPEQICPLNRNGAAFEARTATGMLTPAGDAAALAQAIEQLLDDDPLRRALGRNAASDAAIRFDVRRQVDDYLDFYRDVLRRWRSPVAAA
jgi:glycosyltransferase involved in cell wall biosynthesis